MLAGNKQLVLLVVLPVGAALLIRLLYFSCPDKPATDLVIGILSARYNFIQRESIRRTWLSRSGSPHDLKSKAVFIVGDEDCEIPFEDRISVFGCSRLQLSSSLISMPDLRLFRLTAHQLNQTENCSPFRGVSFQVMVDVILSKVGCVAVHGQVCKEIELTDIYTHQTIFKEQMRSSAHGSDDLVWNELRPAVLLQKGFTGLIISRYEDENLCSSISLEWDTSGLLFYLKSYRRSDDFPIESFHRSHLTLVSFEFQTSDAPETNEFVSRADQRDRRTKDRNRMLRQKLDQEIQSHNDVVVVPVLETYRNLPVKLLQFIHWTQSTYSFKYLMKTDDDCIVDIDVLLKSLSDQPLEENAWWGNFRKRWPVDEYGKWAEDEYVSVTYPPFACGSGYVLTKSLVNFVANNRNQLHAFQGEDVSLGIWLSPVHPKLQSDDRWLCSSAEFDGHQKDFISVPNLTPDRLENIWQRQLDQQDVKT